MVLSAAQETKARGF